MAFFSKKQDQDAGAAGKGASAADNSETEAQAPAVAVPSHGDSASFDAILGPHITEKASLGSEGGKYVFRVRSSANKIEIRRSIEKLYKVTVRDVHTIIVPEKSRQVGRYMGTKSGYKKAIVTLKAGDKIDIVA
jgi:large subunit ribosomal protein L23